MQAWQKGDHEEAFRVSKKAMVSLDHIVNEVLRIRDHRKSKGTYANSELELQLNFNRALWVGQVTREQQQALVEKGPGNGQLPSSGSPLTMERLLNKIKHRHPQNMNFRIDSSGEHFFLVAVDTPRQQPDSIVEFKVSDFCNHCSNIAPLLLF